MRARFAPLMLLALAACSDDASTPNDAPVAIDAAPDAIDAPSGPCGADLFLTGEYVSWDSTTTSFMGVPFSTWTVRGAPTRTAMTNPNGRVELCIPRGQISIIDATKTDYVPAIFVAEPGVFDAPGSYFSSKGFTTARAASFYTSLNAQAPFDATKGHLLVQKHGTPIPLSLTPGGASFAVDNLDDTTWTAGNTGGLVLFTNIDIANAPAQASLRSTTSFVGPSTVPLEPGKLTITSLN